MNLKKYIYLILINSSYQQLWWTEDVSKDEEEQLKNVPSPSQEYKRRVQPDIEAVSDWDPTRTSLESHLETSAAFTYAFTCELKFSLDSGLPTKELGLIPIMIARTTCLYLLFLSFTLIQALQPHSSVTPLGISGLVSGGSAGAVSLIIMLVNKVSRQQRDAEPPL